MKNRILFLSKAPPFVTAGAETVIWNLGKYLAKNNWDVHYLCPLSPTDKVPTISSISFHDVPTPSGYLSSRVTFFLTGALKYFQVVRTISPDIIYDNMSPFPFVPAHISFEREKVVTKIHGIEGKSAIFNKPHIITKIGSLFGYEFLRLKSGKRVISVSESCAQKIRKRVRLPEEVIVIENGIEISKFNPTFSPNGPVLILCFMTPKKGVQTLLRAWNKVEQCGISRELLIAGSGPSLKHYQRLSKKLDLKQVHFLGHVSDNQKIQLYENAFAYVLPTRGEGLVLTNLEAMASKCLVISTPVDGVRDYIDPGRNGLSVPPDSPDELGNILENVLRNPSAYRPIAEAGYETVQSNYDLKDCLRREERYLRRLIETSPD